MPWGFPTLRSLESFLNLIRQKKNTKLTNIIIYHDRAKMSVTGTCSDNMLRSLSRRYQSPVLFLARFTSLLLQACWERARAKEFSWLRPLFLLRLLCLPRTTALIFPLEPWEQGNFTEPTLSWPWHDSFSTFGWEEISVLELLPLFQDKKDSCNLDGTCNKIPVQKLKLGHS